MPLVVNTMLLIKGDIKPGEEVLVRVHSECLTGDAFGSLKCDCGEQLQAALDNIEKSRQRCTTLYETRRAWYWFNQ